MVAYEPRFARGSYGYRCFAECAERKPSSAERRSLSAPSSRLAEPDVRNAPP